MKLRFLGKDSTPEESPTLYATDADSYVIQGWIVTDPAVTARHAVPDDETLVEIPPGLLGFLTSDNLNDVVTRVVPPIVAVTDVGNYIVQGKRVTDAATLSQMDIPAHETCVHVTRTAVAALVEA